MGAVGVIELHQAVNTAKLQQAFVELGVWIRPFGHVIYIMPPYIINQTQLTALTDAMVKVADMLSTAPMAPGSLCHG